MRKPQVGDTVYLKPINNESRHSTEILTRIVKKVGRKYFDVWDDGNLHTIHQFFIDTMLENGRGYLGNWQAHFSLQEIEDEKEHAEIGRQLHRKFVGSRYELTLDQLRRIKAITEEGKGDEC